jgi:hypothetical protein
MRVADMVQENDPTWTANDTRRATKFVETLLETINSWDQSAIRNRMDELRREDQVFAAVVYSKLPAPIRQFLDTVR